VEQLNIPINIPVPTAAPLALTRLPGVSMFDDQGTPFQPEIQVRGFTLSPIAGSPQGISVFLNGVRQNEPDAQELNFDLLPMAAVDQSSLVRGSNVLFGRNSLGGTLLLSTKRGGDKPEGEVEAGGGSFGGKIFSFTGGGKANGIDGFLALTGNDETGWRQATSGRIRNAFATIGHQWGATHDSGDVALDILYGNDKIFQAGSLPASYSSTLPRINYTPGDFFEPELYMFSVRGTQPVGGGIFRWTGYYRRNNYEQFNVNVPTDRPPRRLDDRDRL
jgi:outer membrane receptor for Fe3+-dicitrate